METGSADDVEAIMAVERMPGFDRLVGRWERDEHLAELAKPSSRYFLLRDDEGLAGFAMVQGFGDAHGKVHLRRIAVREPGGGTGTKLLQGVIDWLFTETDANRIDLDVYVGNERAKRAYEKAGFSTDGLLREYHREPDGTYRDMWLMTILRWEWAERQRGA